MLGRISKTKILRILGHCIIYCKLNGYSNLFYTARVHATITPRIGPDSIPVTSPWVEHCDPDSEGHPSKSLSDIPPPQDKELCDDVSII